MTSRKIVAVFDSREPAERGRDSLLQLGLSREHISISDQDSSERTVRTPEAHGGFWAHVKEMFMPDSDRQTIDESIRRGGCVLVASVDDTRADEAVSQLENAGAIDLEERESQWRADSSRGAQAAARDTQTRVVEDGAKIPVVEERLRVGKREVDRGSVRVRSYIVEEPVHEQVRLREERVQVERRPVNEMAKPVVKGSPGDLMQERTVEVAETAEQAVVGKEARVTEEVVVSKTANERVEQIDDSVRRTKVEVEDGRTDNRAPRQRPSSPPK
jgi:uncharacterized protein (TIGR02271 family)